MPLFDDMMATGGAGLLMQVHGAADQLVIAAGSLTPFSVPAKLGPIRGTPDFGDNRDERRTISIVAKVERTYFTEKGITELPYLANVTAMGSDWSIRVSESEWGATFATLCLEREILVREFQAKRNASV